MTKKANDLGQVWLNDKHEECVSAKSTYQSAGVGFLPPIGLHFRCPSTNVNLYLTVEEARAVQGAIETAIEESALEMKTETVIWNA